ncbi:MAG: multicopper oxidase [Barrevirus sp.]|uniref:Multicopper oxidase n=1 Tax=Barrevirus sp. TaxID=2487763 RepID=A0A3G4ZR41_9VIRU|nr:MAG: multicopper oxidase [Barrevirus sp.]
MCDEYIKLNLPSLLDFTTLDKNADVRIVILYKQHKFAPTTDFSGSDILKQPIFGSQVFINDKKVSESTFGLPFIRLSQGSTPKITYENQTQFTFNIHYHGLNTIGSVDGTSMETVFGLSTQLGPKVTFQFPKITNNQSLLWFHSHNMFISMELIYSGIVGLLQIVDDKTKWLTKMFEYPDNQLLLLAEDMDLTEKGTQTYANLVTDENRSSFAIINGQSATTWYSSNPDSKQYATPLYHKTTKNLVKVDILNASLNWRVFHLGVCDKNQKIKPFYLVQTDSGLMNPKELTMAFIPVASRISIIVDLDLFTNSTAYLFFYDYDLTEIVDSTLTYPDLPNDPSITVTNPDFSKSNSTPYPSPIPDPNEENQQQDYTALNYPVVPLIEQVTDVLDDNGSIKPPKQQNIKVFLKIKYSKDKKHRGHLSLSNTLKKIRETVFGSNNYDNYKDLIVNPCFEYDPKINYLSFLNPEYFYNLPNFTSQNPSNPIRNIILFSETDTNAYPTNSNGVTEYVDGANRIMVDLWNSDQLDLAYALQQYTINPNNYKPPILPTSKFRIYKTNDTYSNTAMISNDTLTVQIFDNPITYGNNMVPLASVTVIFPPTDPCDLLNIDQWITLINQTFDNTLININGQSPVKLSSIIKCDWSFFPYAVNFMYQKTTYIKSAIIKTKNNSNYWVKLLGRWPLLQFFGKPLTGDTLDPESSLLANLRTKQRKIRSALPTFNPVTSTKDLVPVKPKSQYMKCDEVAIYGIYDSTIQQIFPFYATNDGSTQLPIACMKRNAELIISPNTTYMGLYDGYLNDNLNSFSVKLKSSETWTYTNGDTTDSHPLHFHLTSGFAQSKNSCTSTTLSNQLTYGRDIYQIGPQESISFDLTWPNYSSKDITKSPNIPCVGGVIHCHFLQHNDANSMIIQYYVEQK